MQQIQEYYAAYQHCQQAAQYYVERYERPQPAPRVAEDYDEE